MKPFQWSYSSLTAFETCPRKFFHLRIAKDVQDRPHEATTWGTTVHEHFERRIRDKAPLPPALDKHEALLNRITKVADLPSGEVFAEQKLAIDTSFKPVTWEEPAAWCRGIVDAGVKYEQKIAAFDWKSGKVKNDPSQLRLFGALLLHHHPDVEEVKTCFVWLKFDQTTQGVVTRTELPAVWNEFLPRVERMKAAMEWNRFPPKPSGLCRNYCPVTNCEFHGR